MKYEYKYVRAFNKPADEILNEWGKHGWKYCSEREVAIPFGYDIDYLLMRAYT